eukprot:Plantae.Rhodophyta-Purpureofilum_apyrenoidigerum.ctg20341.p1 GENE.Plantae.Rhodophyta-Purpureofilum_apyrenoidigerum.ctg20341~~Plantae.Rhodophyta-Purpureofilum_apyrenoidigerum.ctg20341.p1  ORF type:complete len:393 (+),score=67.17 Plantae.Rhodophyta-Purpureofilum_apyrenoidigerum.ctg20341:113-1291(+)
MALGFAVGSGVAGTLGRIQGLYSGRRRMRVVAMGKEQKVERTDLQTAGKGFSRDVPQSDSMVGADNVKEAAKKNTEVVERDQVGSAENPFENTERRKRTTTVPELSDDQKEELLIPFGMDFSSVLDALSKADDNGHLIETVTANRHLISTSFLYNMTSQILKSESFLEDEGDKLRNLRAKILDVCAVMDKAIFRSAANADIRVRDVVGSRDVRTAVLQKGGATSDEANWFWVVLHGAIAAWELQAEEGVPSPYQQQVYDQLVGALSTFLNADRFKTRLGEEFKLLSKVFQAASDEKKNILSDLSDSMLVKICLLCCRVERLKFGAYRGLLGRLYDVRNFALKAKYGIAPSLQPERFALTHLPVSTSFDQFIEKNQTSVDSGFGGGPISTFGF